MAISTEKQTNLVPVVFFQSRSLAGGFGGNSADSEEMKC